MSDGADLSAREFGASFKGFSAGARLTAAGD